MAAPQKPGMAWSPGKRSAPMSTQTCPKCKGTMKNGQCSGCGKPASRCTC